MEIRINGANVKSEKDFHCEFALSFGLGAFYGKNLDALWDFLSADVERPVVLLWGNSSESQHWMGEAFFKVVEVLERVKRQDEEFGWDERFDYKLE